MLLCQEIDSQRRRFAVFPFPVFNTFSLPKWHWSSCDHRCSGNQTGHPSPLKTVHWFNLSELGTRQFVYLRDSDRATTFKSLSDRQKCEKIMASVPKSCSHNKSFHKEISNMFLARKHGDFVAAVHVDAKIFIGVFLAVKSS